MLLSTLGALIFSSIVSLVLAQDGQLPTANQTNSTPIATLYGDSFKNAGGKVLTDKVNGESNKHPPNDLDDSLRASLVYIIFYGDWTSSQDEQTTFMNFIDGVSSTGWFNTRKYFNSTNNENTATHLSF